MEIIERNGVFQVVGAGWVTNETGFQYWWQGSRVFGSRKDAQTWVDKIVPAEDEDSDEPDYDEPVYYTSQELADDWNTYDL